ncbi:MAG TPA: hypothetical protein VIY29_10785 [Ktedonobacteraceae bacterium]
MDMVRWLLIGCALLLLLFWWVVTQVGLPGLPQFSFAWSPASSSHQQQPSSVLGLPSVSVAFINRVLAVYHSPAAGLGQALYDDGVRTGIDPVFALAFFFHESSFGTTGEARKTLALGNERCIPDRPCVDLDRGGYAQMQSWEDGFAHWYALILMLYVKEWHRVTIEQIIPKYAPGSDSNNEVAYIAAIEHATAVWRRGVVWV